MIGAVFALVGVAGFIPGLTTNVDQLQFIAEHDGGPQPELLGLFHVSVLHNLVHLAFGLGIVLARTARGAAAFLFGGGVIYAMVSVYGFAVDMDSDANFLPVNEADNWLHVGLSLGMVALGLLLLPRSFSDRPGDDPTTG